jgi:phosphoglycerol geranylgeranyltransferase
VTASDRTRRERLGAGVGRLAALGRVVGRALPLDTNPVPRAWTHLTKIDPEDEKRLPLLYPAYLRYTDAVAVGGSSAVTQTNTEATFTLLSVVDRPTFHEPSDPTHVTDRTRDLAAFIAVPQVLNGSTDAIVGELGAGIQRVHDELAPAMVDSRLPRWTPAVVRDALADAATSWLLETAVFEAYLVQNPDSAAARAAGVTPSDVLSPAEAARRATVGDRYLSAPVVYVEYSGRFGGREAERLLRAIQPAVSRSRVWYGGGLTSRTDVERMFDAGADAVVVGDVFHEIAREEASLFARARPTLTGTASRERVDEWVRAEVRIAETAAGSYLSTIPGVDDPTATARRVLVDTLTVWLHLRSSTNAPAERAAADAVDRACAAGVRFAGAHDGVGDDASRRWGRAAVGAVRGDRWENPLAAHLSPAAPVAAGEERSQVGRDTAGATDDRGGRREDGTGQ